VTATVERALALSGLANHRELVFWCELAALLLVARVLGLAASRLRVPRVVGELLAGVVLGPSLLGVVWPAAEAWLFPAHDAIQGAELGAISTLALGLLLLVIGTETDLGLLRRLGRPASTVSTGSLALPLLVGVGLGAALAPMLHPGKGGVAAFAILTGLALGMSSLPVVARVVADLGLSRRDVGQLALAAGMLNDTIGFLLLAVVAPFAVGGSLSHELLVALRDLGGLALVAAAIGLGGQWAADRVLRAVRRRDPEAAHPFAAGSLGTAMVLALLAAAAVQATGVEGALGAFAAGVLVGRSRFAQQGTTRRLGDFSRAVFAPLYFASAGLHANVALLAREPHLAVALGILVVGAIGAKLAGTVLGARAGGLGRREQLVLGILLNGRGAVQVVVATTGLALGILHLDTYTLLIVLAAVSSLAAPPVLLGLLPGLETRPGERRRLEEEETLTHNLVVRDERVLVVDTGPASALLAAVVDRAWPAGLAVTVLRAAPNGSGVVGGLPPKAAAAGEESAVPPLDAPDASALRAPLAAELLARAREVETTALPAAGPEEAARRVLEETRLGYGALAIALAAGEGARGSDGRRLLDLLLAGAELPVVVVRSASATAVDGEPPPFRDGVVPVSGSDAGRAAVEVAEGLARHDATRLLLVHVLPGRARALRRRHRASGEAGAEQAAATLLREAARHAAASGLVAEPRLRRGRSTGEAVLAEAEAAAADLVVVGATVRHAGEEAFFGPTAEHVLAHARSVVVVVALPERGRRERAG
jgi:Kef-type K+ transport system membrane component KefB/nucleotide-binding universal stress UspA family protein